MSINQWPCSPDSLADLMSEDMIRFAIAGASAKHNLPMALVEPDGRRYDAFNDQQNYKPFCRYLRGSDERGNEFFPGADEACKLWDQMVALDVLDNPNDETMIVREYSCWMELRDYVIVSEMGGHRYALFSGQYLTEAGPRGLDPVRKAADTWVRRNTPESLGHLETLKKKVEEHPVASAEDKTRLCEAAQDIDEIFDKYWKQQRQLLQSEISGSLSDKLAQLGTADRDPDWQRLETVLEWLCERLGCGQALHFASDARRPTADPGNVLRLRAAAGLPDENRMAPPHFNWQKAGAMATGLDLICDPTSRYPIWKRAIRGDNVPKIPPNNVMIALGDEASELRCAIVLGGFRDTDQALRQDTQDFLDQLLTRIGERVQHLLLQANLAHSERSLREGRDFLAHQVRSRLDMIMDYQEDVWELCERSEYDAELEAQNANLSTTITDLVEFSDLVQADEPLLRDPTALHWEIVTVEPILEAVLDYHASYASREGVDLRKRYDSSALIRVDPFWLRTMFLHLVHNAIKYSRKPKQGDIRWIAVRATTVEETLLVEVENFGLGILPEYLERVFERGTRVIEGTRFEEKSGMGRGLWEARRIASVFGGTIEARSRHHSGGAVTHQRIDECITTFSVRIPIYR